MSNMQPEERIELINIFVPAACAMAISVGMERFLLHITGADCDKLLLDCGTILLSVMLSFIYEWIRVKKISTKWQLTALAVVVVLYALGCIYLFRDSIRDIYMVSRENILSTINSYYRIHVVYDHVSGISHYSQAVGALVLTFPVLAAIHYEIVIRLKYYISAVVFILMLAVTFMMGRNPQTMPVIFMLVGIIALIPATQGRKKAMHESAVMGSIALIAVIASAAVGTPMVTQAWNANEKLRTNIANYWYNKENSQNSISFGDIFKIMSSGGVNGGELGQSHGFAFNGRTQLKLTVYKQPQSRIYMKGFVGAEYTGNSFEPADDAMEAYANRIGYAANRQIYDFRGDKGEDSIRIERVAASKQYVYRPYGIKEETYPNPADKSYYFTFYPPQWNSNMFFQNALENTEYSEDEKKYRDYVYETYLQVPESGLERLKAECNAADCRNFKETYNFIFNRLQSENKYNLNVGMTPQNKDFIEYFLYEQKEGYCSYFASAAVMMFRMKGYPARYVSGYVVYPNMFQQADDVSYTAVVRDDKAHSWAEVYIDGTGWVPVEMTPGFSDASDAQVYYMSGKEPEETKEQVLQPDENIYDDMPDAPDAGDYIDDEDESEGNDIAGAVTADDTTWLDSVLPVLKKAAVVTGLMLMAAAVIWLMLAVTYQIKRIITKRRLSVLEGNSDREYNYNRIVCEMFHWLYHAALCAGIPSDIENDTPEFVRAFEDYFDNIKQGTYKEVMQLAMRANFASGSMTKDEAAKVCDCCRQMLSKIEKTAPLIAKWKVYSLKIWRQ